MDTDRHPPGRMLREKALSIRPWVVCGRDFRGLFNVKIFLTR